MNPSIRGKFFLMLLMSLGVLLYPGGESLSQETESVVLFQDDFEDNVLDGWLLYDALGNFIMGNDSPWQILSSEENHYLKGSTHSIATPNVDGFGDGWITVDFRLSSDSAFHFNVKENEGYNYSRYFIGINEGGIHLNKQHNDSFYDLSAVDINLPPCVWHTIKVVFEGTNIQIFINESLEINYSDSDNPSTFGKVTFETLPEKETNFDNISIQGDKLIQSTEWKKTGGPSGGLGYDVVFHPTNPEIMFVTDNPSGVNKSYDGGKTWVQRNEGINTRAGEAGDGIPIFCLTIDPKNPNIIWTGTQFNRGIYKSVDCGETWEKKDAGVTEWNEITFRGFGVDPNNSDVVYAGAEITSGVTGYGGDKAKGKIYKTTNGGESWSCVWEGGSLVRFVIVNPNDSNIVYASTGIFDREAYNDIGVGVLKSTDAGNSWSQINNGLTNLFVGYLEMHPNNPDILFAATGAGEQQHYGYTHGGIFKTDNGGQSWRHVLHCPDHLNSVVFSPSDTDVVYAAHNSFFYRSEDGGENWTNLGLWGPPGISPGSPIGMAVSPTNPLVVFANNYNGGNFKSEDGGETWVNASNGYTGASLRMIKVDPGNARKVYCVGRSGTFSSSNSGYTWKGLTYFPLMNDSLSIAIHPLDSQNILVTLDASEGAIYGTTDGGSSWRLLYLYPDIYDSSNLHSFKAIKFSPSNPSIIYAGMRRVQTMGSIDPGDGPSQGMFKSSDGGQTWNQINTGLEETYRKCINEILIDPDDPEVVYIGTYKNGIWKTTNGGGLWVCKTTQLEELDDARSLAMHPVNHNVIFAGTRGNGIWKTTDGGDTWKNISIGMPINASILSIVFDPTDPQTIYAADLTSGVYISKDGGQTWYIMNGGLTTRSVISLDISSDGSILYAATSGEGVFSLSLPSDVLYVDKDDDTCGSKTPCYSTIQEAIDAAPSGATIKTAQGTYNEDLSLSSSKELTLSAGWDSTFTTKPSTSAVKSMTISDGGVTIDSIVIQ